MSDEVREMTTTEWIWSLGAAAGHWVKIEPGCEMPEVGAWKRSGQLLGRVEEGGDERVVICHYSKGHKYISDGFKCYGAAINPTHYAVVRMPT